MLPERDEAAAEPGLRTPSAGAPADSLPVPAPQPSEPNGTSTRSLAPRSRRRPSRETELQPGAQVQRYVILERLGRGGMGEVYLAHDPELDRRLALKVIRDERRGGPYVILDRERLRREAQALAQLSHPNVVSIYDVGEHDGRMFIAMELVDGIHLGRWLRAQPRALPEILPVLVAAGRGLAAAHAAGITHRDFKPANVMVGRDGRVCVLDFGLATDRTRGSHDEPSASPRPVAPVEADGEAPVLTETGRTVGTPAYMAPEQHRGQPVDARSDQFAFCVSLFEAVVGQRPFPGSDPSCLLRAKDEHHLPPLPEPSALPAWLEAIIERGLAPAPERRFASMDALLDALERGARRSAGGRRRWWLAGVGAAGLVVASVAWSSMQGTARCEGGPARVAERWSPSHAEEVRQAFVATEIGYAEPAFTRVSDALDAYAEAWVASHRSTCEAVSEPAGRDAVRLDRRMSCLEQRLDRLGATVELLRQADAEIVRRGTAIVAALPTVEGCDRSEAADAGPPPPSDPQLAQRVEALRKRLDTVSVLEAAGRYADGLVLAKAVYDDAQRIEYPPVRIEALRLVGLLSMAVGEHAEAERHLTEAALTAQALPYDEVGVVAMIDLVMLLGEHMARPEEARSWAEHARAALQRSPDPRAEARLWTTEAVVDLAQGNAEASRQQAERALELRRRTLGEDHPDLVGSHNNLGNALRRLQRFDEAEQQYARALALAEQAYGEDHPLAATLLANLGGLRAERSKYAEARPLLERALDIRRRALGPRHPEVGTVLNNLGGVLWNLGEKDTARAMLREALAIQEEALGPDDVKHVPALNNLAEFLVEEHPEEARQHAERALELLERFQEGDHSRMVLTHSLLGRLALRRGDLAQARAHIETAQQRAERLGPEHPLRGRPQELAGELAAQEAVVREAAAAAARGEVVAPGTVPPG